MPIANSRYGTSLNADNSTNGPVARGGSRCLKNIKHGISVTSEIKPSVRIVHPYPIRGNNRITTAGNTRPPVAEPDADIPSAIPRFFTKYDEISASVGQNISPHPRPCPRPCARNNCQYSVHSDVMNIQNTSSVAPTISVNLKYPASVARPLNVPTKNSRKIWILPTHEMSEGGWPSVVV